MFVPMVSEVVMVMEFSGGVSVLWTGEVFRSCREVLGNLQGRFIEGR